MLHERLIQPRDFFWGSFDVFALKAHQHRLRLRFAIPAGLPKMFTDPIILARVFFALVDRAMTVTQQGKGEVRVGLSGGRLVVVVEDEGPWLEPNEVATLFTTLSPESELQRAVRLVQTINGNLTATNEGRPYGLQVKLSMPAKCVRPVLI